MPDENAGSNLGIELQERPKVKRPSLYKVIMHNDHYTTMDFVMDMLQNVFRKEYEEAFSIMLDVHQKGAGHCGIFTRQIAETKIEIVHRDARQAGFPLLCTMEKE